MWTFAMTLIAVTGLAGAVQAQTAPGQPSADAAAPDAQRQLGAHAHGQGRLNIAIEGRTIDMELEAPGADIVGFEHAAKTAEQKAAIAKARAALAKPLALFRLPAAAGCKVTSAKVELVNGGDDHAHGAKADASAGKAAPAKTAAPKDPSDVAGHAEFHADYTLTCTKADAVLSIDFDFFATFPGAGELAVTIIGPKGQTQHKVTRDRPRLDIGSAS